MTPEWKRKRKRKSLFILFNSRNWVPALGEHYQAYPKKIEGCTEDNSPAIWSQQTLRIFCNTFLSCDAVRCSQEDPSVIRRLCRLTRVSIYSSIHATKASPGNWKPVKTLPLTISQPLQDIDPKYCLSFERQNAQLLLLTGGTFCQ